MKRALVTDSLQTWDTFLANNNDKVFTVLKDFVYD